MASRPAEREEALASAHCLALISDGVAMPGAALTSVLEAAPQLKRIVCLSKMGVTRASAGPLGLGRGNVEQLEAENRLRSACASAEIGLSIVRVGTLKGGGPGRAGNLVDLGLSRAYYDNVMDIETLRVTQAYDVSRPANAVYRQLWGLAPSLRTVTWPLAAESEVPPSVTWWPPPAKLRCTLSREQNSSESISPLPGPHCHVSGVSHSGAAQMPLHAEMEKS